MPPVLHHRFAIELFTTAEPRRSLAQVPLSGDLWGPAIEWARFGAVRAGQRQSLTSHSPESIEPVWHDSLGQPYVDGFRVVGEIDGDDTACLHQFPSDYFENAARAAAKSLVKDGRLDANQTYGWMACAFSDPAAHCEDGSRFAVKTIPQAIGLREAALHAIQEQACPQGTVLNSDVPVFVPQSVLDEAVEELDKAGAVETGGVLIGHLNRDPSVPGGVFVEVTAQIPVRHAIQELTALTFTAETWASVDAALKLRRRNERKLGWWHSHPARRWCEKCPVENRATCPRSGDFFSEQDHALHATVFPAAFCIALVVSDSHAHGLTFPMFGWRDGHMSLRGFFVTGGNGEPTRRIAAPLIDEDVESACSTNAHEQS